MGRTLLGAVEAGGTKFNCAIGTADGQVLAETRIETAGPGETLARVIDFFESAQHGPVAAFGIASFGPLDLDPASPTWGELAQTPKPRWSGTDMVGPFIRRFGKPVALDTDVNAAALGEIIWGAGKGCESLVYITVGTGVGGGAVLNGRTLRGIRHPEMGHVALIRHPFDAEFAGICLFHSDCAEGLISGPAIGARFGMPLSQLDLHHPFRAVLAEYLGQLCRTTLLMLAPERIVIGGGVMEDGTLYAPVSAALQRALRGYMDHPAILTGTYVVPPGLGTRSGIMGALALAREAVNG